MRGRTAGGREWKGDSKEGEEMGKEKGGEICSGSPSLTSGHHIRLLNRDWDRKEIVKR